jgi:hypothetical protein
LISVEDFAFRGRLVSLLVAKAPAGSHLTRFPRRSLRLPLQSKAGTVNKRNKLKQRHLNKKRANSLLENAWFLFNYRPW